MSFHKDFLYGFATAAAQIEGGGPQSEKLSGRGDSIWDEFCNTPGHIEDGSHVQKTCAHLLRFKEDVALMKKVGANSYRFSISWPRIIPLGGKDDPINEQGLQFYDDLIDELVAAGIQPFVTLYHWDLPLALHKKYKGWLSRDILDDYTRYARVCFERYGDRVKHWLTFNEPWCVAVLGNGIGQFAPGRTCTKEPWIVGHHIILAHAQTCKMYKEEFKGKQNGTIGITLNGDWAEPWDESPENVLAAQTKMDFAVGWFADPIYLGHYPQSMVDRLGDRLPKFTEEEIAMVKDSSEFYGCNTYTTNTIQAGGGDDFSGGTTLRFDRPDGSFIGVESQLAWLRDVPWGYRKLLNYLYKRYKKPIFCTENGWAIKGESDLSSEEAIDDSGRIRYYEGYLNAVRQAILIDGVDVRSYFAWSYVNRDFLVVRANHSFMDNFEWNSGLVPRFGSVYVDFETFERKPKKSAYYVTKFFQENLNNAVAA